MNKRLLNFCWRCLLPTTILILLSVATATVKPNEPSPLPPGILDRFRFPREVPCTEFLKPYFDWLTGPNHTINVFVVFNSNITSATYSTNRTENLSLDGSNLVGRLDHLSSDQDALQPFSVEKATFVNMILGMDGSIDFKPSNTSYKMHCYSNETAVIFARREAKATGVITFRKFTSPR